MTAHSEQDAAQNAFAKLANIAQNRASVYHLLTLLFRDPTPELAEYLLSGKLYQEAQDLVQWLDADASIFDKAFAALTQATTENKGQNLDDILRGLKVEYARLFIGPGPALVSPYQTIYCDPPHPDGSVVMMGQSAARVKKAYQEAGLTVASDYREPPDHIAVEFEFLYYLCKRESDAWQEDNNAARKWRSLERRFIDENLGKWALEFCRQVTEVSQIGFYVAVALLADTFIRMESGHFSPRR